MFLCGKAFCLKEVCSSIPNFLSQLRHFEMGGWLRVCLLLYFALCFAWSAPSLPKIDADTTCTIAESQLLGQEDTKGIKRV